ncbi:MAG: GNAT family N-acetyltransferase [Gammaproteobacteria bacterium]|nr:GNAT family N-acetyltransferase [Gammaproteobacteria bacterium]
MNQQLPDNNQSEPRRLLIEATITGISEHGLQKVTLAKIAGNAGMTAGSINFHFSSKEALLLDTLRYLADELDASIDRALASTAGAPADRLTAILDASLDPDITEPRKMAVWFAFTAEARTRDDYQRICGVRDRKNFESILQTCTEIIREGDKQDQMNARAMANAVQGLIEEVWQEILYAGPNYDRADARNVCMSFLASVFPWSFAMPRAGEQRKSPLRTKDKTLRIIRAGEAELTRVSPLFDLYRQFYQQPADPGLARKFLRNNIRKAQSVIFLASDQSGQDLGFTQLYPGWCSVAGAPFWILYDLYVSREARQRGVARALMNEALKLARKTRACRIDLETAVDNYDAQALYESLGYERDTEFFKYSLELA